MMRCYSSFLVRCWRLENAAWRIEVEHIQSGLRLRVPSLAVVLAWMVARTAGLPPTPSAPTTSLTVEPASEEGPAMHRA